MIHLLACLPETQDVRESADTETTPTDTGTGPELDDDAVRALTDLAEGRDPCHEPVLVRVDFTVDGDTFYATGESDGASWNVRMIGVNTPEVSHYGEPADCYANEAWTFSATEIDDRLVWLTFDATCRDAYDRTLAYVVRGAGEAGIFERALAKNGYADTLTIAPNDTYAEVFEADVDEARGAGRGMWGACP